MIEIGVTLIFLIVGYVFGNAREKQHFKELLKREKELLQKIPYRTGKGAKLESGDTFLVTGSVVVASDYFKNFVGELRNFFGGRMINHETLLDRARREALSRMREKALSEGASQVVDVHIETCFLDQLGVEVSAYGTAIRS